MKQLFVSVMAAAGVALSGLAQPIPLFENRGDNDFGTTPPQVDALAFANHGTFQVFSGILPFDFQNTLNFTNRGRMIGQIGFRFDTAFSDRKRQPAVHFENHRGASVIAEELSFFGGLGGFGQAVRPSWLTIAATNIANEGLLSAGAGGILGLYGRNINLVRSGLEIRPLTGGGVSFRTLTNFFPEAGLSDNYWAITNEFEFAPGGLLAMTTNQVRVTAPPHTVTNRFGGTQSAFIQLQDPEHFVNIQQVTATNWLVQAAFVSAQDPEIGIDVRFAPGGISTNLFRTVVVELSMMESNVVTGELFKQAIYLMDELAWTTNITVLTNLTSNPTTYRPSNYVLSRTEPFEFQLGSGPNDELRPDLFTALEDPVFDTGETLPFESGIVTNLYAAYSATIGTLSSQPPPVPGLSVRDLPGRVEIEADNLNMERVRIRGNGLIFINAENLISSAGAAVDSENLSFILGNNLGRLQMVNLAKESVQRLGGTLRAYSATWTNTVTFEPTEPDDPGPDPDPGEPPPEQEEPVTVEVGFHVFIVTADLVRSQQPVFTHDFVTQPNTRDVVISDSMRVVRSFLVQGESLTVDGRITFSQGMQHFGFTNTPVLHSFTNNGAFLVPQTVTFGQDRTIGFRSFVNRGEMTGTTHAIRTDYFENSGTIESRTGNLLVQARTAVFQDGGNQTRGDVRISAEEAKFRDYTLETERALFLNISRILSDAGPEAPNVWVVQDGFHLTTRPAQGDLLGTTIESFAPRYARVEHTWAGEDRGPSPAGFQNNVAVGHLRLVRDFDTLHSFAPAMGNNALYVDFLELDGFTLENLEDALEIQQGMRIYFADSNLPADGAEDGLDGRLGGRLRWVPNFTGAGSAVDVVALLTPQSRSLIGQISSGAALPAGEVFVTVQMNRSLRESQIIDSDGDGIVNALDAYPFNNPDPDSGPDPSGPDNAGTLTVAFRRSGQSDASRSISLSWEAQANSLYRVEFTEDLLSPNWKLLNQISNVSGAAQPVDLEEVIPAGEGQRYFRVLLVK